MKIAFFGIFFLISRYFAGFRSIQHLFLKIQEILPRIRGGKVQANHKKQLFLCVKVVIFGARKMAQIAHFHPQRPIGAAKVNVFNTKKVPHWFPDMKEPKVLLHPPQIMDFWPKEVQIWPQTDIFGQISALWPI